MTTKTAAPEVNNAAKAVSHTPTPWKTESDRAGCLCIISESNYEIASHLDKSNAAFIVRAVNAHEDLLETIRWMAQTVHRAYHEKDTFMVCPKNTCDAAKQAIVKAEAK